MHRGFILAAAVMATTVAHAVVTRPDLVALEAYVSDANGDPILPMQAEAFYCTLRYRVDGVLTKTYSVRFDAPYQSIATQSLAFGQGAPGEYMVTWGPMPSLLDSPITLKATLVPVRGLQEMNARNNSASFLAIPQLPLTGSEYFSPNRLMASLGLSIHWNSNPGPTTTWFPKPQSSTFQSAVSIRPPEGVLIDSDGAFLAPANPIDNELSQSMDAETVASSQRINRGMLRTATFADYLFDSESAQWIQPETYVESNSSLIASFGQTARSKAPADVPFDVAEAIYKAVLARCAYSNRTVAPSALTAYRTKKGDCGALSSLFVAACRTQGIPARTVTGFLVGDNQWHVWAEFRIPGQGWIACDPAYAKGKMPKNTLPLYFGVMPDLNGRFASTFGFEVSSGQQTLPLLQAPTIFWTNPQARVATVAASSSLRIVD